MGYIKDITAKLQALMVQTDRALEGYSNPRGRYYGATEYQKQTANETIRQRATNEAAVMLDQIWSTGETTSRGLAWISKTGIKERREGQKAREEKAVDYAALQYAQSKLAVVVPRWRSISEGEAYMANATSAEKRVMGEIGHTLLSQKARGDAGAGGFLASLRQPQSEALSAIDQEERELNGELQEAWKISLRAVNSLDDSNRTLGRICGKLQARHWYVASSSNPDYGENFDIKPRFDPTRLDAKPE